MASDTSDAVLITCAVTGSANTVSKNPAVPVTPEEIAELVVMELEPVTLRAAFTLSTDESTLTPIARPHGAFHRGGDAAHAR